MLFEKRLLKWDCGHGIPITSKNICQEHYCKISELKPSSLVRKLFHIIRVINQYKHAEVLRVLRRMKRITVEIVRKEDEKKGSDEEFLDSLEYDEQEEGEDGIGTDNDIPLEPPKKRQRKMHCCEKPCTVEGCQKTHFWSKKWAECSKCKRNFCPAHAHLIHQHRC